MWIEIIKIDTRICHFNIKFPQSYICYWWSYLKFHGDPILSDHWLIIFCYIYFLHLLRDEMINPMKQINQCKKKEEKQRKMKKFHLYCKMICQIHLHFYSFSFTIRNILNSWQLCITYWPFDRKLKDPKKYPVADLKGPNFFLHLLIYSCAFYSRVREGLKNF